MTIIGFPPAGGWVTFNKIIRPTPRPTAKGIVKKIGKGTKCKIINPTLDVTKWPKKTFFGCANGLSGYPYKRTIEDPKEANKKIPNSVLYVRNVSTPIVIRENIPAKIDCFKLPI
tara:strand:- start:81 stop:425 length:345 start_codon:yes stop_codon:yes gene_type:complete